MARLVLLLAIAGFAYWYWSGHLQGSPEDRKVDRLQENAAIMQRCIKQEERMQAAGGLAGVADVGGAGQDAEAVCARKNDLHRVDGQWYSGSER
jgi:hypothetical protein